MPAYDCSVNIPSDIGAHVAERHRRAGLVLLSITSSAGRTIFDGRINRSMRCSPQDRLILHHVERLHVKMSLGAERFRERASGALLFPFELRREFPTIGPGQSLSNAPVEP